jgi:hypothetical protein
VRRSVALSWRSWGGWAAPERCPIALVGQARAGHRGGVARRYPVGVARRARKPSGGAPPMFPTRRGSARPAATPRWLAASLRIPSNPCTGPLSPTRLEVAPGRSVLRAGEEPALGRSSSADPLRSHQARALAELDPMRSDACVVTRRDVVTIKVVPLGVPGKGTAESEKRNRGRIEIDLRLYSEVLGRHRALVLAGVALTIALAFLSYVRVSADGISYRKPVVWSNSSTVVLTQSGSPELRSVLPVAKSSGVPTLAGTDRFVGLVELYAALATSDEVVKLMRDRGLLADVDLKTRGLPFSASPVKSSLDTPYLNGGILPVISISGRAPSPAEATRLATGATKAFLDVLTRRQENAKIPRSARVEVTVLKRSGEPVLAQPRSKALPLLIIFGGLIATVAVAFARDNRRRREPTVDAIATPRQADLAEVSQPPAPTAVGSSSGHGGRRGIAAVSSMRRSTLGTNGRARELPAEVSRDALAAPDGADTVAGGKGLVRRQRSE